MDILDENLITEKEGDYALRSPKFLRRLRVFSIITLANSLVLFLFPVLFTIVLILGAHINGEEMLAFIIAGLFFIAGGVVLYMSHVSCRDYLKSPDDQAPLLAAMRWFFYFWLLLMACLVLMAVMAMSLAF